MITDTGYRFIKEGNEMLRSIWLNDVLFSMHWFFVVLLTIAPWVVWYFLRDPSKSRQYFISSWVIILFSTILDLIGLSFDLWRYHTSVFPIMSGIIPWNSSLLPVCLLIVYKIKETWSPIIKGLVVSAIIAFIGEPYFDFLGITEHHQWRHIYSFPIYFLIYLFSYYIGLSMSKNPNHSIDRDESDEKYNTLFQYSCNAIYYIEKTHLEKNYRFTDVNDTFIKEMGYSLEELRRLDPRMISDQSFYNIDII
ncbi:CBO0543 family protein [Neobacillus sp. D3-1R]|uniref:CBO0543 family protein n=1 Tax=Neobacillus sp. D3-1R TaxID=3445778 RepID=UPI003FA15C23